MGRARATLGPALLSLLLLSCGRARVGRTARGITNGTDDGGDLGVVALLRGGAIYCSGTLVAPRVVLSAAHCVLDGPPDAVLFGSALGAGTIAGLLDERIAPGYDEWTGANDLALLLLASTAPSSAVPWPLLEPSEAATILTPGAPLRLVGFGLASRTMPSTLRKRQGSTTIQSLDPTRLRFAPDPSQTCEGDSGGPAFVTVAGSERLAGVAIDGDPSCDGFGDDLRVDPLAMSFIAPYLAETADGAAPPGGRCFDEQSCERGSCVFPADAPHIGYCSTACAAGVACPSGMACDLSSGACRYPAPSPGAPGTVCAENWDCDQGLCARTSGEESARCRTPCFADAPSCPAGEECLARSDQPGASACFPPSGSDAGTGSTSAPGGAGCSTLPLDGSPRGSLFAGELLLLLLLGIGRGRALLSGPSSRRHRDRRRRTLCGRAREPGPDPS